MTPLQILSDVPALPVQSLHITEQFLMPGQS